MNVYTYTGFSAVFVALILFAGATTIRAEEGAPATSPDTLGATVREKVRPLQIIKEEARVEKKEEKKAERVLKKEEKKVERIEKMEEKKVERAEKKDEKKENREVREEAKEKAKEDRGVKARVNNLLRAHLGAIINRLTVSVRHFETLVERMESRIQKLQDRGFDTTAVEALLRGAVGLIVEAKADVETIKNMVDSATDATDTTTLKQQLRGAITEATASVKAAHQALTDVAKALTRIVRASVGDNKDKNVETETEN
ncbi:MAG TPA: hypothetical protein VJH33_02100 [Candidatus Paceibacterota bacterium]